MAYLTLEQKEAELEALAEFLMDIGLAAEVIDSLDQEFVTDEVEDDKLILVEFPGGDGPIENLEDDGRVLAGRIIQVPGEEEVYSKHLLLYAQIAVDVSKKDELAVLKCLNDLNRLSLGGTFFYAKEVADDQDMVQFKMLVSASDSEPFDEGVIGEAIINFGIMYDAATEALEKL